MQSDPLDKLGIDEVTLLKCIIYLSNRIKENLRIEEYAENINNQLLENQSVFTQRIDSLSADIAELTTNQEKSGKSTAKRLTNIRAFLRRRLNHQDTLLQNSDERFVQLQVELHNQKEQLIKLNQKIELLEEMLRLSWANDLIGILENSMSQQEHRNNG